MGPLGHCPLPMATSAFVGMKIHLVLGTRASRKGLLDGAGDPPGFNAGIIDHAYSSRDVPVN